MPASQQLLNSWKYKRMTGVKFSWRIENPNLIMTTSMIGVGRSIQTPGLGDTLDGSDRIFNATVRIPYVQQDKVGSGRIVVQLDINKR